MNVLLTYLLTLLTYFIHLLYLHTRLRDERASTCLLHHLMTHLLSLLTLLTYFTYFTYSHRLRDERARHAAALLLGAQI